jgi:hypothetical protein
MKIAIFAVGKTLGITYFLIKHVATKTLQVSPMFFLILWKLGEPSKERKSII